MDLKFKIRGDLGISQNYVKVLSDKQAICLVHSNWLSHLQTENQIPKDFCQYGTLSDATCQVLLDHTDATPVPSWKLIVVQTIQKLKGKVHRLSRVPSNVSSSSTDLSYFQLIHYVTETNYRNLWKQAWRKYHSSDSSSKNKTRELQGYNEAVREVIKRLYSCQIIRKCDIFVPNPSPGHCSTPQTAIPKETIHPNLVPVLCAIESDNYFYLIYDNMRYSLHHCVMFSPAILEISTVRRLFVVYQLLQVLQAVHDHGLYIGAVTLLDISIKQNLWIQVMPRIWDCLEHEVCEIRDESKSVVCPSEISRKSNTQQSEEKFFEPLQSSVTYQEKETCVHNRKEVLSSLIEGWIRGAISNFDYLMELNTLAGRVKDNPHCHPVIPWIMNFTTAEGGWRELAKTKFRLNKGDKQLDLLYESATHAGNSATHGNVINILQDSAISVPHHTSEVLTDITYYVYKARRMSQTVLCQHVRPRWVPAEYPSTMERLQEWTPDECIPEFFSDSTIFYSIHPDLCDIGIPSWCDSPEDFIRKHRAALESDHVSERLHHWIDLTFGYRLSGSAAVKSKNVCLSLMDQHTTINSHGMVQLFTYPHPHKLSNSLYFNSVAPKTFRNVVSKMQDTKDSGDDETSSESSGKAGRWKVLRSKSMPAAPEHPRPEPRPENQTIVLPKDYNPLSALKQLESFYTFMARTRGGKLPDGESHTTPETAGLCNYQQQSKDMLALGCLISEIALSSRLKSLPRNLPLEERYAINLQLLKSNRHEVPRCFQQVIRLLLQLSSSFEPESILVKNEITPLPGRYPPVSESGLPPPSAHQLLQPLIHTVPFPPYFSDLYSFLQKLNHFSERLETTSLLDVHGTVKQNFINKIAKSKINFAAERLALLFPLLNVEAIDLLTPYLQEMFENPHTSLLATWHLFGIVSQCLGPQQTARKLLKTLTKVFDTDTTSSKHRKLYHRTFLLQLIVRLGLHTFLTHFITILIEAIGGSKDFALTDVESCPECNKATRDICKCKRAQHLSPELAQDAQELLNVSNTDSASFREQVADVDPQYQLEADDEKDPESFDFDEASEESIKIPKDLSLSDKTNLSSSLLQLPTHDDDKWKSDEDNDDPLDDPEGEGQACDDDDDDDDEPDLLDALASPITECKKHTKTSMYSQSAPNLTSHLSNYKCSTDHPDSKNADLPQQSTIREHVGKEIRGSSGSSLLNLKLNDGFNVSDVSAESIVWLAHRLGPVLTARYLARNLLRMLTLCYDGPEKQEVIYDPPQTSDTKTCLSISNRWYSGDRNASKVLECLSRIAALYGEQFIMLQYLPHIADLLALCKRRVIATLESGLLGAMALLQHIIPYLSDATLMDHLQDVIIKDILYLVIRLISSLRLTFPSGGQSRWIITCRLMDIIYVIGLRIGFEMTRKHLSNLLQRFFSCFDKVYDPNGALRTLQDVSSSGSQNNSPLKECALEEMRHAFTPEMAYLSYIPFCKLAGGIYMEHTLKNDELIRHLCLLYDMDMAHSTPAATYEEDKESVGSDNSTSLKSHRREPSLGQDDCFVSGVFGKNVAVVGNRLDVQLGDESHLVTAVGEPVPQLRTSSTNKATDVLKYDIGLLKRKMDNSQRHLKGNWLAYWEHETGRSEKDHHFDFKQIKLQSFVGHTGAIRTIQVLDNENSFITSSKDKTVKLWSLRSCGDGSSLTPSQWTYTQHRKSVFAVAFLDSLRVVGSCDSTVHIWDPFMGSCIKQLEPTKGSPVTVLTSMPAPSTTFLAATTNSTVRFLDARTCKYMHEFKVSIGTTGLIRCLAVSPSGYWLAVGHSTGMISVLDVRTGLLFGTWMGHEGEILQLKAFNNSHFVTSSLDHTLSVWNAEDSQPKCNLRGPLEPVTSLNFYKGEVISGTTGNKIGVHTSIDRKATYSSVRLRSDTFKGMLTTTALLPLNRLLLLGADNGNVSLLS